MADFVISGGDFLRTEGCLSLVTLDEKTGALTLDTELRIPHPRPEQAVNGKGITGMCLEGDSAWVCFSNLITKVALAGGELQDLIEDEAFNDLHQLTRTEQGLLLANTGNESADFISFADRAVSRVDLLGASLRGHRPHRRQDQDTKPHLHHLAGAVLNDNGELLLALGRQARILNLTRWEWVGPRLGAGVHDVQCAPDGAVWCTNVGGLVWRIGRDGTVTRWSLSAHQEKVGWTRGLAVTERGIMVGTTAIRDSNRAYYRSLVEADVGRVDACVTWIPFEGDLATSLVLPAGRSRKVFAICERQPHAEGDTRP